MLTARHIPFKAKEKPAPLTEVYKYTNDVKVSVRFTESDLQKIEAYLKIEKLTVKKRSSWIDSCVRKLLSLADEDFNLLYEPAKEMTYLGSKSGEVTTPIPVGLSADTNSKLLAKVEGTSGAVKGHLVLLAIDYRISILNH